MPVILMILLWVLGLLLLVVALAVATPLRLRLSAKSDPTWRSRVVARPFAGMCVPITIYDSTRPHEQKPQKEKTPVKSRTKRKSRRSINAEALRLIPATIGQMLRQIHVDNLLIDGEFGTGDPAETGQIFGQLTPFIYANNLDIRLRPNFAVACLRGRAEAQLSVIPIRFLWPLAALIWHAFGPRK